jgi:SnoaL-like protein
MSLSNDSAAIRTAVAHIDAWSNHDWDASRAGLASDVWVTAHNTDPSFPVTDLHGTDDYMKGLIEFAQAVVPGSPEILATTGDKKQALVTLNVRVKFGPDAPEMTLPGSRAYLFDDNDKIKVEHVVFFVAPS